MLKRRRSLKIKVDVLSLFKLQTEWEWRHDAQHCWPMRARSAERQ